MKDFLFLKKIRNLSNYFFIFSNWTTCLSVRKKVGTEFVGDREIAQLRNGLKISVRVGTPDIVIVNEVFGRAYVPTEKLIKALGRQCTVIDLGGNIGAFALRCANASPVVEVHSYEPGPQNAKEFEQNLGLNPHLKDRVLLFKEAASATSGVANWLFDEANPGGSRLTSDVGTKTVQVQTRSFKEIIHRSKFPIAFIKMDIEGSEYALLKSADIVDWEQVPAIMAELHKDPSGESNSKDWLKKIATFGFSFQKLEAGGTVFLSKVAQSR